MDAEIELVKKCLTHLLRCLISTVILQLLIATAKITAWKRDRFGTFLASGIYLLLGISSGYIFSIGLANGITAGFRYPIQQRLLIGAALTGAAALLLSAILVHFRPIAACSVAAIAATLLWLALWPFYLGIVQQLIIHRALMSASYSDVLALSLLPVATSFSILGLLRPFRS